MVMVNNKMCKDITGNIKNKALQIGFDLVGISPAGDFPETQYYKKWLSQGYHAGMHYMERNREKREDVRNLVPDAKSVISCALNYNSDLPYSTDMNDRQRGWISRYAWSEDYHFRVKEMIEELKEYLVNICDSDPGSRGYVDTGPVLERAYAKYAGIGWTGKNSCIINQELGSWLFLAEIITDLELDYDYPVADRCGTCNKCVEECPTDAIREPYVVDSGRCISYLTIENKGEIPAELREDVGNNIFGCDICQDVCPWNRKAETGDESCYPWEGNYAPDLGKLADMSDEDFRNHFRKSPVKRAKRKGLMRNVLVAMGNSGNLNYVKKVENCLYDEEPLVRSHAAWAIWKLRGDSCLGLLSGMLSTEENYMVIAEINRILNLENKNTET